MLDFACVVDGVLKVMCLFECEWFVVVLELEVLVFEIMVEVGVVVVAVSAFAVEEATVLGLVEGEAVNVFAALLYVLLWSLAGLMWDVVDEDTVEAGVWCDASCLGYLD